MRLFYISSQFVKERQPAGMIQMLYGAKEFQKKLGNSFKLVIRGTEDKFLMNSWGLEYEVSKCPFRARIIFYILWMPIFWLKQDSKARPGPALDREEKVLYCLDWHLAIAGILYKKIFGYKVAIEYHDPPFGWWKDWMITRFCDYLFPTTQAMGRYLVKINKKCSSKIFVAPNGIDLKKFDSFDKESSREVLGLPVYGRIVLYSGNLVPRKGVFTFVESASIVGEDSIFMLVGRSDASVMEKLKEKAGSKANVVFKGERPHEEIPLWLNAADVVVAPNSLRDNTWQGKAAAQWTSPMKLFEYMAAKKPIVVSDIPAVRELLDETMAVFVCPDDAEALAIGIESLLNDKEKKDSITKNAYEKVKNLTWENRAEAILNFIRL